MYLDHQGKKKSLLNTRMRLLYGDTKHRVSIQLPENWSGWSLEAGHSLYIQIRDEALCHNGLGNRHGNWWQTNIFWVPHFKTNQVVFSHRKFQCTSGSKGPLQVKQLLMLHSFAWLILLGTSQEMSESLMVETLDHPLWKRMAVKRHASNNSVLLSCI